MELGKKYSSVIEVANRASIQNLPGLADRLDSHESDLNTDAHNISNITDLQSALDGKANTFTGYTGSLVVVTSVNFGTSSTATATINISNGIITSIT